jgi:hypothetical protein
MTTNIIYFSGEAMWAKVFEPDTDYDKTKKSYKIDLYMDDKSWQLFEESGLQLKVRENAEGKEYVTFKRPSEKVRKGQLIAFDKPTVLDANGDETTDRIGNGSEVIVKVSVYDGNRGKGHTLEAVKVTKLVPYNEVKKIAAEGVVPF